MCASKNRCWCEEMVKGYEFAKDQHVVFEPAERETLMIRARAARIGFP